MFSRYDYAGVVVGVYGVNTPHRFDQVKKNYEEYAVTGFKLKYIPSNVRGGVVQDSSLSNITTRGSVNMLWSFEDINTYNINGLASDKVVALETFRTHDPTKSFRCYRNNKPLAKQM